MAVTVKNTDTPSATDRASGVSWAVVHAQPNRDAVAVENLARQRFEVYGPLIRKRVRHARKSHDVLRPLFPGYLFVAMDPADGRWRAINSTLGVRALVRFGNQISSVDHRFIAGLKAREIEGVIALPANPFAIGQNVRLLDGPFEGLVAKIIEMDEKSRLVVLMDFLNRGVRIHIDGRQVMPL